MNPTDRHRQALDLARSGHLADAEALYRAILDDDPADAEALHFFAVVAASRGEAQRAAALLRQALDARPDWAKGWNTLGGVLFNQGLTEDACDAFRNAVRLVPDVDRRLNLAKALRALGRLPEALDVLNAALTEAPDDVRILSILGVVLTERGDLEPAADACRRAVALTPDDATAHNNLGNVLRALGQGEAAEAAYRRAVALRPDMGLFHGNLANMLRAQGRLVDAVAEYRLAVEYDPTHTEPFRMLADQKAIALGDPLFDRMKALVAEGTLPVPAETQVHFALASVYEQAKDADGAFAEWRAGNALKRSLLPWDDAAREDLARRIVAGCDGAVLARTADGAACPSAAPIFILGMPRSGTTLVEQILAAHSEVDAGGELPVLPRIALDVDFPDGCRALDGAARTFFGERYVAEAAPGRRARFTDKLPENFLYIGLIRLILPNAKIVHCSRDPLDTCLSCYGQLFAGNALGFSYDLEDLAREHARHDRLMAHWRAVAGEAMYDVSYEALIADKETEVRRLLAYCGLDFEPACLSFYKTKRAVETASAAQVRQDVYTSSVERWRPFAAHLKPVADILGL